MKYQFMPMFWGDFFANTLHLSAQELGAYTALIGHAWEHDANIAVEDLQRVARVSNYHWPKVRPRLTPFFNTTMVLNFWHHERISSELTKAAEISNKRKGAALQMHSKCRASAYANTPPSTTTTTDLNTSLGKEEAARVPFYAEFGAPELDAWDAYGRATTGKTYPRDKRGGWTFPSQWPPNGSAP